MLPSHHLFNPSISLGATGPSTALELAYLLVEVNATWRLRYDGNTAHLSIAHEPNRVRIHGLGSYSGAGLKVSERMCG